MIDLRIFTDGMDKLGVVFNKELTPKTIDFWYKLICDELTDAEFNNAVTICAKTCEFFPTPKRFIESIKGNSDDQAFDDLLLLYRGQTAGLTEAGKHALSMCGGICAFNKSEKPELIRRDFERFHQAHVRAERRGAAESIDKDRETRLLANIRLRLDSGLEITEEERYLIANKKFLEDSHDRIPLGLAS